MSAPTLPFEMASSVSRSGTIHISVSGAMDHANRSEIDSALDSLMTVGPDRVVIDCSSLAFIDCGGLGAVATAATSHPATIIERTSAPNMLRRMIAICHLDEHVMVA